MKDIRDGIVDTTDPLRVDGGVAAKYRRTNLRGGEVLLTLVGTVGEVAVAPPEVEGWNVARALAVIRPKAEIGADWVRIVLEGAKAQQLMHTWMTTTVQATLNLRDVERLPVAVPPADVREAIVSVVSALDSRIAVNAQIVRTAKQLAQTHFRGYFVDFEHATELVDSDIGPIPERWEVKSLPDIARFVNGGAFTKSATGTGRMILRIADLNNGPGPSTKYGDFDVPEDQTARAGDILFAWSGSLGLWRWPREEAVINQHIFKCIAINEIPDWYLYWQIAEALPGFKRIAADKAVTMGHIKREHLAEARFAVPDGGVVLEEADKRIRPLMDRWLAAEQESLQLVSLRSELVAGLMDGRLKISEKAKGMWADAAPLTGAGEA